jgi:hypothetical protein
MQPWMRDLNKSIAKKMVFTLPLGIELWIDYVETTGMNRCAATWDLKEKSSGPT